MPINWVPTRHSDVYHEVGFRRVGRWDWELFGHRYGGGGSNVNLGGFRGSAKSLHKQLRESYGA